MGYRITYVNSTIRRRRTGIHPLRLQGLIGAFLILFLLLTNAYWPAGAQKLREFLIPGDPEVTMLAAEELVQDLHSGEAVSDAVAAFCREILESAEAAD